MIRYAPLPLLALLAIACGGTERGEVAPETADQIRKRIEARIEVRNDTLRVPRPGTEDTVALAYDHVHEEIRLTPGGRYAACVDFHGPDGEVWDIDYYVRDENGDFAVEDVVIHMVGDEDVLPESARRSLDEAR